MRHFRRLGVILCLSAGCGSGETGNSDLGTISLALSASTRSVDQGNGTSVLATLTRGGAFAGPVNFTVTGAPPSAQITVSDIQTIGTVTTANVTVGTETGTPGGTYVLTVHGTGSGVTEATATLTLTVALLPTYTLTLSKSNLAILQGSAGPTITVTLARKNFAGSVILTVDKLPAGVTAVFTPANPTTGNTSVLTLTVANDAPPGVFTDLRVRGGASVLTGLDDRTAPLTLTIGPDFELSLTQSVLSAVQGGSTTRTTVTIARTSFAGPVELQLVGGLSDGLTVGFAPASPTSGNSSVMTLTVDAGVIPGVYNLGVLGTGTPAGRLVPFTLTVLAGAGVPVGNFTLSTQPSGSVDLVPGVFAAVTVNINHSGGNISSVALSTTSSQALPAGLSLEFSANPARQAPLLFVITDSTVPVGSYPIVIHGNAPNLAEQTVNLTINVVAPGGSGSSP